MDRFTRSYVECALWANELEHLYPSDLPPELRAQAIEDCARFQEVAAKELSQAYAFESFGPESAGHDFYLTRERHGTGFWDRENLEEGGLGKALTAHAHAFGNWDDFMAWTLDIKEEEDVDSDE